MHKEMQHISDCRNYSCYHQWLWGARFNNQVYFNLMHNRSSTLCITRKKDCDWKLCTKIKCVIPSIKTTVNQLLIGGFWRIQHFREMSRYNLLLLTRRLCNKTNCYVTYVLEARSNYSLLEVGSSGVGLGRKTFSTLFTYWVSLFILFCISFCRVQTRYHMVIMFVPVNLGLQNFKSHFHIPTTIWHHLARTYFKISSSIINEIQVKYPSLPEGVFHCNKHYQ